MLGYIVFSFLVVRCVDTIKDKKDTIQDFDMGMYSEEWSKKINTTEINNSIPVYENYKILFNNCLWGSISFSIAGIIAIAIGCSSNPNRKDLLDIVISLGIISFIFGIIFVSFGYFCFLETITPEGFRETISPHGIRLSYDFLVWGIILLSISVILFIMRMKLKMDMPRASARGP